MTFEKVQHKIDFYRRFREGSELGDGVNRLLDALTVLNGIGQDHEVALVMLAAEKLIRDYMEMGRTRELSWEEYERIDADLYAHMLGGARKLTKEEYKYQYHSGD